jgi:hypothetical protein
VNDIRIGILAMCLLLVLLVLCLGFVGSAQAQTPHYIGPTCTLAWNANPETDLAGYRAFAVQGATQGPVVTIPKTSTSHPTSTTCAALGVAQDGLWTFNVLAFDLAGNVSHPATIQGTRDTLAPAMPGGLSVGSPQPIAMSVTPNPAARQATVAWVPGGCTREFIVSRLVSGRWVEIGRTHDTWLDVPLVNAVNQPYGISAVCGG